MDPQPAGAATASHASARRLGLRRATTVGVAAGAGYGLLMRVLFASLTGGGEDPLFSVMFFSFIALVPLLMGFLAVRPLPAPRWSSTLFLPWLPVLASLVAAHMTGWEGSICLIMGAPIMLIASSVGGIMARVSTLRSRRSTAALLVLPLLIAPLESRFQPKGSVREVRTERVIDAPPAVVWRNVVQVREILPSEQRPALFTSLGFPRPLSAVLDREKAGGIRHARFEGGVLFIETITNLEPERRLAFTLEAREDLIPPTTLDPHVTIGGPYFDMLDGAYELEPLPGGRTHVVLTSRHRLSTRFDFYSGLWSDAIMRSIQRNILAVVERRAESPASRPG